jgi:DNA/RNA-binding domain of Phe-tRNA-synthetase-like protein
MAPSFSVDDIRVELPDVPIRLGIALLEGIRVQPAPETLRAVIEAEAAAILAAGAEFDEATVKGVRQMLRTKAFKPTGRNRPASEYLMRDLAASGEFRFINAVVDVNNILSLRHGLPISVLDASEFAGRPVIRHGAEGESYVFNPAGQELSLHGLITVADETAAGESTPLGTPIKDSQRGKLAAESTDALAVCYGAAAIHSEEAMAACLTAWVELAAPERATTRQIAG